MSTNHNPTPRIVAFYDPAIQAPDPHGRTVPSILALPDASLEYCHDYIQMLFPLPETSMIHPSAPTIDSATFAAFRARPELRDQLTASLVRMLHFYGLKPCYSNPPRNKDESESESDKKQPNHLVRIDRGANFDRASRHWVKRFDHNHLRITRIIRCLRVLGLEDLAQCFFRALRTVYDDSKSGISERSMMFWTRAAERPLYLAPEDERDEGRGKDFLYEYEASRKRQVEANGAAAAQNDGNGQGADGAGGEKDGTV